MFTILLRKTLSTYLSLNYEILIEIFLKCVPHRVLGYLKTVL